MRLKHANGMRTEGDVKSGGCRAVAQRLADASNGMLTAEQDKQTRCHSWLSVVCRRPVIIDELSRKLFPLVFVYFNVAYWVIYLHISEESKSRVLQEGV